jgi:hypothetical protein
MGEARHKKPTPGLDHIGKLDAASDNLRMGQVTVECPLVTNHWYIRNSR